MRQAAQRVKIIQGILFSSGLRRDILGAMTNIPDQLTLPSCGPKESKAAEWIRIGSECVRASPVFHTYWRFAAERQEVFFKRLQGVLPTTRDGILSQFKFTNAYRASDRVSQFLIRHVIYQGDQTAREVFFRTLLFKFFNKIETWRLLMRSFGELSTATFSVDAYGEILSKALSSNHRIYSAAYIMPSGGKSTGGRKHVMHLKLLETMLREDVPAKIAESRSMSDAFHILRSYRTIGDFLAYQFVTDLNYSEVTDFEEMDFVVPGPGARDGIRKCFPVLDLSKASEVIRFMADSQERQFEEMGIAFRSLWGRRLQLIDCQNIFCEVDKYSRRAHPEIAGLSGRTRIKQQFRPNPVPLRLFYPPKWGINTLIPQEYRLDS